MYKKIKRVANEHRKAALLALLALLLFGTFSVNSCMATSSKRAQETATQNQGKVELTGVLTTQEESAEGELGAKLTDSQRVRQDSYSSEEKEFLALLGANLWVTGDETRSLAFTPKIYTETTSAGEEKHPFVITALEGSNYGGSNAVQVYIASVANEEQTQIMTLTVDNSVTPTMMSLESKLFANSSYKAAGTAKAFSVTGMNSSFGEMIDGKTEELKQALADYCATAYPTATTAKWRETASIYYPNNEVSTVFTLNNSAKTQLSVAYNTETHTFKIE